MHMRNVANCKGPYGCKDFDSPSGIAAARL